jgi:DNA repair protein RecO
MSELKDSALLLRRIPYSDTSLICHFLTRDHGRVTLMARGARRAKSPMRAALAPLHELNISWRPGRTGMGTLVDVDRSDKLLDESRDYEGLELCAVASTLFQEGDPHGYVEVMEALALMQERSATTSLCAGLWQLLMSSGWVGDFTHCWGCGIESNADSIMSWHGCQLICSSCGHGMTVSAGMRKGLAAQMKSANVSLSRNDLSSWQRMIQDVLRQHGVKPPASFIQESK